MVEDELGDEVEVTSHIGVELEANQTESVAKD